MMAATDDQVAVEEEEAVTETPTAVIVMSPATGEVLDLTTEPEEVLAEAHVVADEHVDTLRDFTARLRDELLVRLDRTAVWTHRVGDPTDVQYEIKAPSPTAGTESFDAIELKARLRDLVRDRVIDEAAAGRALERTITVTFTVPLGHDVDALANLVRDVDHIAGAPVGVKSVSAARSPVKAGIAALRKVPGTTDVLATAARTVAGGARRVSVKAIRKERP